MKVDINKIDGFLELQGWSYKDLAEAAGISDSTIRSIRKKGSCRASTAELIAGALSLPVEAIAADEEGSEAETSETPETPEELPAPIMEALERIHQYGEDSYQRGKENMCDLFLRAVTEAIERWEEFHQEGDDCG